MARTIKKLTGGAGAPGASGEPGALSVYTNRKAKQRQNKRTRTASIRRRRNAERQNIAELRRGAETRRGEKTETFKRGVRERVDDTTTRINQYVEYCNDLKESYTKKHGEVEEATRRLENVRKALEGLTTDILRDLKAVEMNNISEDENKSNVDKYMPGDGENMDDMLALIDRILATVPTTEQAKLDLTRLKEQQQTMSREREQKHETINQLISRIRGKVGEIKGLGRNNSGSAGARTNSGESGNNSGGPGPGRETGNNSRGAGGKPVSKKAKALKASLNKAKRQ